MDFTGEKGGVMKRQHPDNPDLFWCPKCKTYKAKYEFWKRANRPCGIQSKCIDCQKNYYKANPEKQKARSLKYYKTHPGAHRTWYEKNREKQLERGKARRQADPHKYDESKTIYNNRARHELLDSYIRRTLKQTISTVSPELIQLKRLHIITIRLNKQLKERIKYESDSNVIAREQFQDEEVNAIY